MACVVCTNRCFLHVCVCVYFYVCVFMYACVRSYFGSNLAQIRFVVNANLCLHRCLKKNAQAQEDRLCRP